MEHTLHPQLHTSLLRRVGEALLCHSRQRAGASRCLPKAGSTAGWGARSTGTILCNLMLALRYGMRLEAKEGQGGFPHFLAARGADGGIHRQNGWTTAAPGSQQPVQVPTCMDGHRTSGFDVRDHRANTHKIPCLLSMLHHTVIDSLYRHQWVTAL